MFDRNFLECMQLIVLSRLLEGRIGQHRRARYRYGIIKIVLYKNLSSLFICT
jgi:hypothetical protein